VTDLRRAKAAVGHGNESENVRIVPVLVAGQRVRVRALNQSASRADKAQHHIATLTFTFLI
jgi:hypothetical protein